jgi:hypothetical protein
MILHDKENKVPAPKQDPASDLPGIVAFGVISTIFLGLAGWQPKAATWIAEAIEAESPTTTVEATFGRSVAEPMRKPMQPTAWSEVIDPRKLAPGK